eukprot:CAMPEP_0173437712 /NCGR_PEP_ID=MMETSP1357-20121228/18199_1 /TAXON_ID=77926 /ORGANISM="Hemiselmis rufescens, Strain PCC563" /LENGTH=124 /DNA_ID=CAMNT_0014402913 /DNA_START=44 /DNA_END=418 /DNA_ORIENTATION=-
MTVRVLERIFSKENPMRPVLIFSLIGLVSMVVLGALLIEKQFIFFLLPPSLIYFWLDAADGKQVARDSVDEWESWAKEKWGARTKAEKIADDKKDAELADEKERKEEERRLRKEAKEAKKKKGK